MYYLLDTCVFMHTLSNIYEVAKFCKDNGDKICITQTILEELIPNHYEYLEDPSSKQIYTAVNRLTSSSFNYLIKKIDLEDVKGAKSELIKIRERFYSWMHDGNYLHSMIEKGMLCRDEIKNLSKKDMGECELLAIAKVCTTPCILVTNDWGRIYKHPFQNIFSAYQDEVKILSGDEWIKNINYCEN